MEAQAGSAVKRINVLKIPVDVLPEEGFEEAIKHLLTARGRHQIVLLSLWDLLRARRSHEVRAMVNNASLVIPISISIVRGARFLRRAVPVRYSPFDFIIKLLGVLERSGKSVYLLGSRKKRLQAAERNIKSTFPGLRVVGRYAGYVRKTMEPRITEAIRKATPSLLMVGRGMAGKERWIARNQLKFDSGIFLWCDDVFDIFAERRSRPPKAMFANGLEWMHYIVRRPWQVFRFFSWMRYNILLLAWKIAGK